MLVSELPIAVLQAPCYGKNFDNLSDALEFELAGEVIEGLDLDFDESMVWDSDSLDENGEPEWFMVQIDHFTVWTKSKILSWNNDWKYFQVLQRHPDPADLFKVKGDL